MFRKVAFCICLLILAPVIAGCAGTPESAPDSTATEPEEEMAPAEEIEAKVVVEAGSSLAIRKTPGIANKPDDDVLDRVPNGRILKVKDTHENTIIEDEHTWWEVEDITTGISGWAAADFLEVAGD